MTSITITVVQLSQGYAVYQGDKHIAGCTHLTEVHELFARITREGMGLMVSSEEQFEPPKAIARQEPVPQPGLIRRIAGVAR